MRYFGSKGSTIPQLSKLLIERVNCGSICDPFGGMGTVGAAFKKLGFDVWSGDILTNAHYFQVAKLVRKRSSSFNGVREIYNFKSVCELVSLLNNIDVNDWFVEEYAIQRGFFTIGNARKVAGCISLIKEWDKYGLISFTEKAVLLSSLVNSMDKVANTAGTYYAYLKNIYRKASKPFVFELIDYVKGDGDCQAFQCDAKELVLKRHFNILYLDPPYNSRSYAGYYHLPETLALLDTPTINGKSGVPDRADPKSNYNKKEFAYSELESLLLASKFDLLAFHYTDDGLIERNKLRSLFKSIGSSEEFILDAKGYATSSGNNRSIKHRLYLVKNA